MTYRIISYSFIQRRKNLKKSLEIGRELGFSPYVMKLYTSQLKEVEAEIQKEIVMEKKQ